MGDLEDWLKEIRRKERRKLEQEAITAVIGIYLQGFGIFHAFDGHGIWHGIASIFIPPYAWFRAIEIWFH